MKLGDFPLLADENIDSEVVAFLRGERFDVRDVREDGLHGSPDEALMRLAVAENRVIVTHDSDFGTLAIQHGEPIVGIVFLRPGHIDPIFTIETISTVLREDLDVTVPFLLVAKRTGSNVSIRYRPMSP